MQTARLCDIYIIEEKGKPGIRKEHVMVREQGGIEGDRHCDDSKNPISIVTKSTLDRMRQEAVKGLCFRRFKANLILEGDLEFGIGMRMQCGEIVLEITGKKGECFEECKRYSEGYPCELREGCWFAKALNSGQLKAGEAVKPLYDKSVKKITKN